MLARGSGRPHAPAAMTSSRLLAQLTFIYLFASPLYVLAHEWHTKVRARAPIREPGALFLSLSHRDASSGNFDLIKAFKIIWVFCHHVK
jgi:hypothetical protein